ncbi:helix-turn-helix domain-containing protein [Streptomyces sp. NPDC059445]|uniref:helix-turn-helix domain-containing protein n=1 Tax=Streptomyces sp. NPDC059445 TaxID=3346832 RepID=UPI0036ACE6B1
MSSGSADEPGWDVSPEDEIAPVVEATGRQVRLWREAAGMRAVDFGRAIGYGEDLVRKVERGARIPRADFLDRADDVLKAGGHLRAFKEDMEKARYPKKVRELKMLEERAVELVAYCDHNMHGLLQTEDYARALFEMRQPAYSRDEVERAVLGRMARRAVFDRDPSPSLVFVQEEVTLRRPLGGRMILRRQLERLLEVGKLRNVTIQVMPTDREEHAGMQGETQVLKFEDGTAVGRSEGAFNGRPVTDPKQLRILELRHGMIRAQALGPRESSALIERVLGET